MVVLMLCEHCRDGLLMAHLVGRIGQTVLQIVSSPMLIWTSSLNDSVKWNLMTRSSSLKRKCHKKIRQPSE